MSHIVDVIIPTYNNLNDLTNCVTSLLCHTQSRGLMNVLIINNGDKEGETAIQKHDQIKWFHTGKNLGWEGGLKYGLERSKTEFVIFLNDDTYIPYSSSLWLLRMLQEMKHPDVGMVGPSSNVVAGKQNIFLNPFAGPHIFEVDFLIGFCVLLRREYLDAIGGVDDTLPGGDDFDLSIRMRDYGKKLLVCMDSFIYHHGFRTGHRTHGTPDKPGGWNSVEMQERTNRGLIQKHGFKKFIECHNGSRAVSNDRCWPSREEETTVVRKLIKPGIVIELGCGATKTIPEVVGVDIIPKGDPIPTLDNAICVADVQADVEEALPFEDGYADTIIARHILEHVMDVPKVMKNWASKLKPGGRLVISVPDENIGLTIPMNPQHKHAFIPESLRSIAELIGLKQIEMRDDYNGVSFTACYERRNGL